MADMSTKRGNLECLNDNYGNSKLAEDFDRPVKQMWLTAFEELQTSTDMEELQALELFSSSMQVLWNYYLLKPVWIRVVA